MSDLHRHFYINDRLEFSFFFDPSIKNEEDIIKKFQEDKDWIYFCARNKLKLKSYVFSSDTLRVDIKAA